MLRCGRILRHIRVFWLSCIYTWKKSLQRWLMYQLPFETSSHWFLLQFQNKIPSHSKIDHFYRKTGKKHLTLFFCACYRKLLENGRINQKEIPNLRPECSQQPFYPHTAAYPLGGEEQVPTSTRSQSTYQEKKKNKHWQPNDPSFATESSWFMATSQETEEV